MSMTLIGRQKGTLRESSDSNTEFDSGQDGEANALSTEDEMVIPLSPKSSPESVTSCLPPCTFARQRSSSADLPPIRGRVLNDPEEVIKHELRQTLLRTPYDVSFFYKDTGLSQKLARSPAFESIMLLVIAVNSVWIFVDTDYNPSEVLSRSPPAFQFAEHCFCTVFVCEWMIRFTAFNAKSNALRDGWFVFDTLLVFVMVLDTWVMQLLIAVTGDGSGSFNPSILRLVRLLRLIRVARMARLIRYVPELMILIKGMATAMRSVLFTLLLILSVTYVFGIACAQLTVDTESGSLYFSRVPHAMYSLIVYGTFLDSIGKLMSAVMADNPLVACLVFVFIFLSAMTLMNLLIGILCEVVTNVAQYEKEEAAVMFVKGKLQSIVETFDENKDLMISKTEFEKLIRNKEAIKALHEVGVDPTQLVDIADVIFESEASAGTEQFEGRIDFPSFMELVLEMRGCNTCTVRDVVDLKRFMRQLAEDTDDQIQLVRTQLDNLTRLLAPSASSESHSHSDSRSPIPSGPQQARPFRKRSRRSLFHSSPSPSWPSESSNSEELVSPPKVKSMKANLPDVQPEEAIKRLDNLRPVAIHVGPMRDISYRQTSFFCDEFVNLEAEIMGGFTNLQKLLLELNLQEQSPVAVACWRQKLPCQEIGLPHRDLDPSLLQPDCTPGKNICARSSSLPGMITSPKVNEPRQRDSRQKLQDLHEQVEGLLRATSKKIQKLKDQYPKVFTRVAS